MKNLNLINKKEQGDFGEKMAVEYLTRNGYQLLLQNYRFGRFGEIDIIASNDNYICFIEVKTRTNTNYGFPAESVTYKKQQKIRRIAQSYINKHKLFDKDFRFDVIEVFLEKSSSDYKVLDINLIKNAF
jgi:putative endonuclease